MIYENFAIQANIDDAPSQDLKILASLIIVVMLIGIWFGGRRRRHGQE
jgi:hypothetical protein